jgi:hypothetical protein
VDARLNCRRHRLYSSSKVSKEATGLCLGRRGSG